MKTSAVRAADCGHPTATGPCRRSLTADGTCGITHRRVAAPVGVFAAAGSVAVTDPMGGGRPDVAVGAAAALDTIGRWHRDHAADVLEALEASGASSTDSEEFCGWISRTAGIDHRPVPFGRVVIARSLRDRAGPVWVEAGRNRFRVLEQDGGVVEVVPVGRDGRPRPAGAHVVDGGVADGIAYGMRWRPGL